MAKVQMEAALSKGVSWGMAGDDQVHALGLTTLCPDVPDVPPQWRTCSTPALAPGRVQSPQDEAASHQGMRQASQVSAPSTAASV